MNQGNRIEAAPANAGQGASRRPLLAFALVFLSMFLNLALAFLSARGLPISSGTVIAVQATVTAAAVPSLFSQQVRFRATALFALAFILLSVIVTNFLNPFNPKTIYDILLIPIYIALGMSGSSVRPKWMNYLLVFVVLIVAIEVVLPTFYVSLFDPAGYLSSTRQWIANQKVNDAANDGLYVGSYRAGGSQFSLADHRIGGPFLEPLSLGYFAFIMSTYYAGLHRGSPVFRTVAIVICLLLALASDSRIPSALIVFSTVFLVLRLRLPVILVWLTFPVAMAAIYLLYIGHFGFLYGDTFTRLSVTFDALNAVNVGQMLVGMVPLERVGDSGTLYMLRCVGLLGTPVAIWLYSGAYTYRRGSNVSFFVMITVYLTITLMFGGATLSIKTGSLLGYLVGIASQAGRRSSTVSMAGTRRGIDESEKDGLSVPEALAT